MDQYQLSPANPQLLQELGIRKLREIRGETDLEAPVWAGKRWGSALVVELEPGAAVAELPVHLRYLEPSTDGEGYRLLKFPEPALFWACDAGVGEWEKSPFERARVGWEGWFEERTLFWDLTPKDGGWGEVRVPVVEARYGGVVRWGTMVAVVAGFAWVCWKVVGAGRVAKEEVEKKKQ